MDQGQRMSVAVDVATDDPIRVLLVEDSHDDFRLICDLLDAVPQTRFSIDWARDLRAAQRRLDEDAPDVCLVDQGLPDGEGLELAKAARLRSAPAPIVLLSGQASRDLDRRALALGIACFLDKNRLDSSLLERSLRYAIAQHRELRRLRRLAQRDELTGLANRALLQDRTERALAHARRHERLAAVMVLQLDLDPARLGRQGSQGVLRTVARRLCTGLRETDTVARLGDTRFALVIEHLERADEAALVARKVLALLAPPVQIGGAPVALAASLGIALYPQDGDQTDLLLSQAEAAMARAHGRSSGYGCHNLKLEEQVEHRRQLEADLARALAGQQLVLHFQPQISLSAEATGIAAQLRWQRPGTGLIDLDHLLGQLLDRELQDQMVDWLLQQATAQTLRWQRSGFERLHLAVPLGRRRPPVWAALERQLGRCLDATGLQPDRLELELEEHQIAGGHGQDDGLLRLRRLGVRIALDRFGQGAGSLKLLRPELIDTIKLAPSLHRGLPGDARREALVGAIVDLAGAGGLRVVACGVEDERQFAFLRRIGCHAAQILLNCPPLPAEACTAWLHQIMRRSATERPRPTRTVAARPQEPSGSAA